MLPGGLCNTAPRGTIPTPDSSYDWKSFGEHVRAYILLFGAGAGQKVDPARGPERGEPVRRQRLDRREVRDEGRVARESLFLKDAGDFQNGLRLLLCPLNPGPRSRPPIDIDATRVLHRDAHYELGRAHV